MITQTIKYLVLSDIHFGSNKNKSENIVDHLYSYFKDNHTMFSKLQIIFIAGDIFDRLLSVSSTDNILATKWLTSLVYYCIKFNIKLRVLEGTPSHDNKQAIIINNIIGKLRLDIDFKYIENISIEHMDDYNLDILYIPDEANYEASDTLKEVKDLMDEKGISKVDIAIMHGAFKYQIPVIDLPSMHMEQEYLSLVKYFISIGHIHTCTIYKRILAQGSFDRMAHNEEEKKGGMVITLTPNEEPMFKFIENKNATTFKTIVVKTEDVYELIEYLSKELYSYKQNSHIRLSINKNNPILKSLISVYKRFPMFNFTNKQIETNTDKKDVDITIDNVLSNGKMANLQITKDNVYDLLMEELDIEKVDKDLIEDIDVELNSLI